MNKKQRYSAFLLALALLCQCMSALAADEWICSYDGMANTGKYCQECARPKAEATADVWQCPVCGKAMQADWKFCYTGDGGRRADLWDCPNCGRQNNESDYCPDCSCPKDGSAQSPAPDTAETPSSSAVVSDTAIRPDEIYESGQETTTTRYNQYGVESITTVNKAGVVVYYQEEFYDSEGNWVMMSRSTCDDQGNLLNYYEQDLYSNGWPKVQRTYDENGNLVYKYDRESYPDGTWKKVTEYRWDSDGNILTYSSTDYDQNGNETNDDSWYDQEWVREFCGE